MRFYCRKIVKQFDLTLKRHSMELVQFRVIQLVGLHQPKSYIGKQNRLKELRDCDKEVVDRHDIEVIRNQK